MTKPSSSGGVNPLARLLFPAIRWDRDHGFDPYRSAIEEAISLGVGGFILFGGDADAVFHLTSELHSRSPHLLLIASDFERGAGQQFRGATPLPPAAALGWLDDLDTTRRAAELTAREALSLGINWIYAPIADADFEPNNPIIGTRAFDRDPLRVARHVAVWVAGCEEAGALACAKHFPGHGRSLRDSHVELPSISASTFELSRDLVPFQAAINNRVSSIMTAHVAYPALDPSGLPATMSPVIIGGLLRNVLNYHGIVVTDALIMKGFGDEGVGAVRAVQAGCDALLYPEDLGLVLDRLSQAVKQGEIDSIRIEESLDRLSRCASSARPTLSRTWGAKEDRRWALAQAKRTIHPARGAPLLPAGPIRLEVVDDDLGGPFPPFSRHGLPDSLRAVGAEVSPSGNLVIAVYCDIRAWKGRSGLSEDSRRRVASLLAENPDAPVLLFAHPRIASEIPDARHVLVAWGGEVLMQEAAVACLMGVDGGMCSASSGLLT